MSNDVVAVFGGAGFIGEHVVQHLARAGAVVRVVTRDPDRAGFLRPLGDVGQIVLARLEGRDEAAVEAAIGDAGRVVNLIGILHERRAGDFDAVHRDLAGRIARVSAKKGVSALVHLSAIGAISTSKSAYARSKAAGEAAVREAFPTASILRPSIVFGPGDGFFARFAEMAALSPFLPLVDGGRTRFQPVYVGDVADAVMACLTTPRAGVLELGGPRTYSFRHLLAYLLEILNRRRLLLPLPSSLLSLPAKLMEYLPSPPLTRDQLLLLQQDNVVTAGAPGLADLGIQPTPLEAIVPGYVRGFARRRLVLPAA